MGGGLCRQMADYARLSPVSSALQTDAIDRRSLQENTVKIARIESFIDVLKAHKEPVMLRLGGEFSGPWNGYHPWAYPVAFRKIVNMFRARGVTNVAFTDLSVKTAPLPELWTYRWRPNWTAPQKLPPVPW